MLWQALPTAMHRQSPETQSCVQQSALVAQWAWSGAQAQKPFWQLFPQQSAFVAQPASAPPQATTQRPPWQLAEQQSAFV